MGLLCRGKGIPAMMIVTNRMTREKLEGSDFVEFDSMINVRPSQGNMSRLVEDERTRETILTLVAKWIER